MKNSTLIVFTENKPGVLNKIAILIRKKMYNVESITAFETETSGITRITLNIRHKDAEKIDQIRKQILKIVEVKTVVNVTDKPSVARELALVKVAVGNGKRAEVSELVHIFRGNIVDVSKGTMIVEIVGSTEKIESAIQVLSEFKILEIARTGVTAMER